MFAGFNGHQASYGQNLAGLDQLGLASAEFSVASTKCGLASTKLELPSANAWDFHPEPKWVIITTHCGDKSGQAAARPLAAYVAWRMRRAMWSFHSD